MVTSKASAITTVLMENSDGDNKDDLKKQRVRIEDIYSHAFWLEKFNKENKIRPTLFEKYLPNAKNESLTPKFYSKYCEIYSSNNDYQKYFKLVESNFQRFLLNRNAYTVCQNQEYGWMCEPFTKLDAKDRMRLMKPKCRGELSNFAEKLEEQKITSRPKFCGLIFKL